MISWFTRNDVAANLLMFTIAITGLYSLFNAIPLEFFPSFESNRISVRVALRGSSPEESERAIATRLEEAVKDLEGVEEYFSRSSEGGSTLTVRVEDGYDPRNILSDIKTRVDAISTFPANIERPVISLEQRLREVISVTIAGNLSEREIRELGEQVREDILQLDGVTQAQLTGVRDFEIAIDVDQDTLREFDLTLQQVANAISRSSLDLSGGNISAEGGEVLIRSRGQAYRQNEFEAIVLKTNADGSLLRLSDIAAVNDGFEEKAIRTRFNGNLSATVYIYSTSEQSAIEVSDKVKAYVETRRANLPQGLDILYWGDRANIIKKRINTLVSNAIQGSILVILLLSLFLRPAVAFWVFLGIPVSFLGAFISMAIMDVSLNMISLFAFIVVLGIVVDDAIVTGENVYTHLQKSDNGLEAAINGTKEVAVPVTFGVLTTVVAFIPLGLMSGHRGPIFAQIPLIVVPVLLFSLIESKLVLPAHLKHIRTGKQKTLSAESKPDSGKIMTYLRKIQAWQRNFASAFELAILKYYQPLLKTCLNNKGSTILLFTSILAAIIFAIAVGHTRFTFFPRIPSETARLNLTMPTGTPFEVTDRHMERVLQAAQDLQKKYIDEHTGESIIKNILTTTGGRGGATHQGSARFEITSPENRTLQITSPELAREWRRTVGNIPGAEEITFRAEIGRSSDPIDIQIHSNNYDELAAMAQAVKDQLATYNGVFDINDSLADGKQELRIDLKPEAHLLGISRSDIIRQVRQAFFGVEAQRIQRGRDDVRVMVRFPKNERNSVAYLNNMLIQTGRGQQVPLAQIAEFTPDVSPTSINRINGYRTVNIVADIEKESVNMTALTSDLVPFLQNLIAQRPGTDYRLRGEQEEQSESLMSLLYGLFAVLFIIYCLLAIPFRSYTQPIIVMSVIPFGAIGAMLGHWLWGMNLTIMSLMGLLALVGILVNDSLVLVDYINKTRARGHDLMDAILTSGAARFRPVMLTSLTTFFGLMPLLFEKETQAQFLIPMAISLGFGIIFATFITLILVPVNYMLLENLRSITKK